METTESRLRSSFVHIFIAVFLLMEGRVNALKTLGHFKCRSGLLYPPRDCSDVYSSGETESGIYSITPADWTGDAFDVYCNMTAEDCQWTVFQRRVNGSVDFYRNWTIYKQGFGELDHEFWLGNDKLFYLSNQGNYTLRIDMVNNAPYYAEFDSFRINNESYNYRLSGLGNYNGTADTPEGSPGGYALSSQLNDPFSTFDRDNDEHVGNCAVTQHGAWWYSNNCGNSNLNGDYHAAPNAGTGIRWFELPGSSTHITYTEMKIRRNIET